MLEQRRPVPVRTIMATIGLVLATAVAIYLVVLLARIEMMLVVAMFFAIVLSPLVHFVQQRLHAPRGVAVSIVFVVGIALVAAMLYAFIRPLVGQTRHFTNNFPRYVHKARTGQGPVGSLVKRYNLDDYLDRNQPRIKKAVSGLGTQSLKVVGVVAKGVAALLTIAVLTVLMILYGPGLLAGGLGMLSPPVRERVKSVAVDCARAMTGYVAGNLLISLIAGVVTFVALWAFGVPFKGVLALWVGFADLIPLVGATLGAIPTILVALIHSTTAGVGMIIVYVVYQQFENHVLQVVIMSKTVQINQLAVLVSVLIGVELGGLVGALLAIPVAGVIQVIGRDIYDNRRGGFKAEPTIGAEQVPMRETGTDG